MINFVSVITSEAIYSRVITPNFGVTPVRRSIMSRKYGGLIFPLLIALSMMFSACGSTSSTTPGHITIQLFFPSGQGPERDALNATLKAFSDRYPGITVDVVQLPEGRYTDEVNVAALAHSLPCLLDFDGPTLYNYAWSGYLIPLDRYMSPEMKADFLPSIIRQGTYNHHLYSLGQFDSGLGIYANKHYLSEAGVRLPTINNPSTLTGFHFFLAKLMERPGRPYPVALGRYFGVTACSGLTSCLCAFCPT